MNMLRNRIKNLSDHSVLMILLGAAILSSVLSGILNLLSNAVNTAEWWIGWLQNFSTEMFGAFLTYILLDIVIGGRHERQVAEERRHMQQISAVVRLRMASTAETRQIVLQEMRTLHLLRGVNLYGVDLSGANLAVSNLEGAQLGDTNLQQACLSGANLRDCDLQGSNLQGADLRGANLEGAHLTGANLYAALVRDAEFDRRTVLPDGIRWMPGTSLRRYTGSGYPNLAPARDRTRHAG